MLTPNPNECNSTLTSGMKNIYPYHYIDVNDRGHRLRSGSPVTNLPGAAAEPGGLQPPPSSFCQIFAKSPLFATSFSISMPTAPSRSSQPRHFQIHSAVYAHAMVMILIIIPHFFLFHLIALEIFASYFLRCKIFRRPIRIQQRVAHVL